MIYTNISGAYDMLPFDNSAASYLADTAGKIPVEYIGSSTLDDSDRRRRRSSLAKDKENITNMHLVSMTSFPGTSATEQGLMDELRGAARKTEHRSVPFASEKRNTSKVSRTSYRICTRNTKICSSHTHDRPTKSSG
jgi:hypothetical protein